MMLVKEFGVLVATEDVSEEESLMTETPVFPEVKEVRLLYENLKLTLRPLSVVMKPSVTTYGLQRKFM